MRQISPQRVRYLEQRVEQLSGELEHQRELFTVVDRRLETVQTMLKRFLKNRNRPTSNPDYDGGYVSCGM